MGGPSLRFPPGTPTTAKRRYSVLNYQFVGLGVINCSLSLSLFPIDILHIYILYIVFFSGVEVREKKSFSLGSILRTHMVGSSERV